MYRDIVLYRPQIRNGLLYIPLYMPTALSIWCFVSAEVPITMLSVTS